MWLGRRSHRCQPGPCHGVHLMPRIKMSKLTGSDLKRFWDKVDTNSECWIWMASVNGCGYGRFRLNRHTYLANRIAYYIHHGIDPEELCVCHTCDKPQCVNPAHLWLGTHGDNAKDAAEKKRMPRGELHNLSKLTTADVKVIRKSKSPWLTLAQRYGVSRSTIASVRTRQNWKHIGE